MGLIKKLFGKEKGPDNNGDYASQSNSQPSKVDVNKPVENPRLKEFLNKYNQQKTNDILNDILEEIVMKAYFLSVITMSEEPEADQNGMAILQKDTIIEFPMLTSTDNQVFYPVFTDWIELSKWQDMKSPKTLILSFDDYAKMVLKDETGQGIAINPTSNNFVINRQLMEQLKTKKEIRIKGVSEQVISKETHVLLGEPKNYPTEMVNAIKKYLKSKPTVKHAWLRLMVKEKEQSFLIVVDFNDDKDKVFSGIAGAARTFLSGMFIDMVPYNDNFGRDAVQNVVPFYTRK